MKARNELVKIDSQTSQSYLLNEKEKVVNLYMEMFKKAEYESTKEFFLPSRPIESYISFLYERQMYKLLKELPKGDNLHLHDYQVFDRRKVLEIVMNMTEYEYLYIYTTNTRIQDVSIINVHVNNSLWIIL